MKIFKLIPVASIFVFGGLLAGVVPASADIEITYTTSGVFSGGTTANTPVFTGSNSNTVTYLGLSGQGCLSNPVSDNCDVTFQGQLGQFTSVIPSGNALTASGTFTLTIDQTLYPYATYPAGATSGSGTIGSVSFVGQLSAATGGQAVITFVSPPAVTIQGVTYALDDLGGPGLLANQLAIGPNQTVSLGALIYAPGSITGGMGGTTPEPALYGLTGAGLAGLAAIAMRRKRKQTA